MVDSNKVEEKTGKEKKNEEEKEQDLVCFEFF